MKNRILASTVIAATFVAAGFSALAAEPAFDTLIAHSGGSDAPKNTAAAFRDSVERGFGFECDVRLSKDGRLFTFHDDTLKRLTGGADTNAIYRMDWDDIARLNVAEEKWRSSRFDPCRPALFEEEVLPLARDGRWIFVEVKPEAGVAIVPYLKKALAGQEKATPKNTLFISFSADICKALKEQMPEYKAFYLTTVYIGGRKYERYRNPQNLISDLKAMGVDGVDAPFYNKKSISLQTEEYIKAVKAAGLEYHVWTVNSPRQAKLAFKRGVQTVTTDVPETSCSTTTRSTSRSMSPPRRTASCRRGIPGRSPSASTRATGRGADASARWSIAIPTRRGRTWRCSRSWLSRRTRSTVRGRLTPPLRISWAIRRAQDKGSFSTDLWWILPAHAADGMERLVVKSVAHLGSSLTSRLASRACAEH